MIANKEIIKICEGIENGNLSTADLVDFYTKNFTFPQLVEYLAYTTFEMYKVNNENKPIPISKDDYLRIRNLFKIRGYKILPNGTVVEENRGGNRYTDTHDSK